MRTLSLPCDTQLGDIQTEESIRLMVDSFYNNVRQDELLGSVFEDAISDWESHMPIMYEFWKKLLFGTGDYKRNPFQKHVDLPVSAEHFTRWVQLFLQTIDDNFSGPKSEEAKRLAQSIAGSFQIRMGINPIGVDYKAQSYSRN